MDSNTFLDFDLEITLIDDQVDSDPTELLYRARVTHSPAGTANNSFHLPLTGRNLTIFLLRIGHTRKGVRRINSPEMEAVRTFGRDLYRAVFDGSVGGCLTDSLNIARKQDLPLRLRLHLADAPALIDVPWEFLCDPVHDRFFSQSINTPIVRYMAFPGSPTPLPLSPPLNVLVIIAIPGDYELLDVEEEWRKVKSAVADLEQHGLIYLKRLAQPSLLALEEELEHTEYHVVHFIGHGAYDEYSRESFLLLEDINGRSLRVGGDRLGILFHDYPSVRLCLLNTCEGARTDLTDPFSGVAQRLVQQGIPSVIAMQFEITDEAAIMLSEHFYHALVSNQPIETALGKARRAIYFAGNDIEWGTPVLYMQVADGRLFNLDVQLAGDLIGSEPTTDSPKPNKADLPLMMRVHPKQSQAAPPQPLPAQEAPFAPRVAGQAIQVESSQEKGKPQNEPSSVALTISAIEESATSPMLSAVQQTPMTEDVVVDELSISKPAQIKLGQITPEQPEMKRRQLWVTWLVAIGVVALLVPIGLSFQPSSMDMSALVRAEQASIATATAVAQRPTTQATHVKVYTITLASDVEIVFVHVPAGEFTMGSSEAEIDAALVLCNTYRTSPCTRLQFEDELAQHKVKLDDFWVMQTEVTNALYDLFIKAGGYTQKKFWDEAGWTWREETSIESPAFWKNEEYKALNQPVVGISWYEADAFAKWLSSETGHTFVLPTEAQWEKAARGTDGRIFPWGNLWDGRFVNYCDSRCDRVEKDGSTNDGYSLTAPVDTYIEGESPYGARHMAGNVWEWVVDYYDSAYYNAGSDDVNQTGPERRERRSLRGGSWGDNPNDIRVANRFWYNPFVRHYAVGLRLVSSDF